jgi:hypothetical protein
MDEKNLDYLRSLMINYPDHQEVLEEIYKKEEKEYLKKCKIKKALALQ